MTNTIYYTRLTRMHTYIHKDHKNLPPKVNVGPEESPQGTVEPEESPQGTVEPEEGAPKVEGNQGRGSCQESREEKSYCRVRGS